MKTIILAFSLIILGSCNKDAVLQTAKENGETLDNILDAYKHDLWIHHSSTSFFATEGSYANIELKATENGPTSTNVNIGNFYFDNSLIKNNGSNDYYVSESSDKNMINCMGKNIDYSYEGNLEQGFEPFTDKITIVKAMKSNMTPKTTRVDKTKNFAITWESIDPEDDLALYINWHGDRNIQIPRKSLIIVKDNGSYTISNSLFKDFSSEGKLQIQLIRFDYNSQKVGNKKILTLSTSKLEGLFKIIEGSN